MTCHCGPRVITEKARAAKAEEVQRANREVKEAIGWLNSTSSHQDCLSFEMDETDGETKQVKGWLVGRSVLNLILISTECEVFVKERGQWKRDDVFWDNLTENLINDCPTHSDALYDLHSVVAPFATYLRNAERHKASLE